MAVSRFHLRILYSWLRSRVSSSWNDFRYDFASRAKSRRDVAWFILWHLRPMLDLVLLTIAVVGLLLVIHSLIVSWGWWSWLSASLTLVAMVVEFVRMFDAWPRITVRKNEKVLTTIGNVQDATELPYQNAYVFRSDDLDTRLRKGHDFTLSENQSQYNKLLDKLLQRKDIIEKALKYQLRKSISESPPQGFWNERKLCLASDLDTISDNIKYYVSSYYVSFLTNELSMMTIETRETRPQVLFGGGLEEFPATEQLGTYILKSIAMSRMGNHIGISTIAHTADNYLVLWRQTKKALFSQDLIAPTGSGSCDDKDLTENSLLKTLEEAMKREYSEESSERGKLEMKVKLHAEVKRTAVLGYFRSLIRGGKPEFVGTAKLESSFDELEPNIAEVDLPEHLLPPLLAQNNQEKLTQLDKTLKRTDLSVPLWVNIICLKTALMEDPTRWNNFFFN